MFNSTKAKRDSHGVWWCAQPTTIEVSMERVFGVTVDACKNEGNNNLCHINEQQGVKDLFGLFPHCIHPEDHYHYNWNQDWGNPIRDIKTHSQQQQGILVTPRWLPDWLQYLDNIQAHTDNVEAVNWCAYTCGNVINSADNQNLNAYNYQKTLINNKQGAKQKNSLSQGQP